MSLHSNSSTILVLLVVVVLTQCVSIDKNPENDPKEEKNKPPKKVEKVEKVQIKAEPSATSRGAIGQGFEIRKMDLLTTRFEATGAKIFEELPMDECTASDKLGQIQKEDSYYSSTRSLYESISTSTKVSGSLQGEYTLGASVKAVTNNVASGETTIKGISLDLKASSFFFGLKRDCINNRPLVADLKQDFEALPKKVENPWQHSSWRQYTAFFEKYGSHFVTEVTSGSSIYQYVFAKSDSQATQQDFTIKACLELAGPTESGKVGISACSGVNKTSVDESISKDMVHKLVVRGGKSETRADLVRELTAEQINKFLKEAETDPSPIQYHFEPIWTLLKTRYVGQEHFAKAANLEQFYKGYLHFGCPHKTIDSTDFNDIQKFNITQDSDPEAPTYGCWIAPDGCHANGDCHFQIADWCSCSGQSCLRYRDKELPSGSTKKEVFAYKGEGWGWQGCKLKIHILAPATCECTEERKIWLKSWTGEGEGDNALRDVHWMLLDKNRRDKAKRHRLHC